MINPLAFATEGLIGAGLNPLALILGGQLMSQVIIAARLRLITVFSENRIITVPLGEYDF